MFHPKQKEGGGKNRVATISAKKGESCYHEGETAATGKREKAATSPWVDRSINQDDQGHNVRYR